MNGIKMTKLDTKASLELFARYWKYGDNYEDSTVLVDKNYNIIGFFDNKTENIDVIMSDLPFSEGWILANGEKMHTGKFKAKYYSYDYNRLRNNYKAILAMPDFKKVNPNELWKAMVKNQKEYNINYFTNLIKEIQGR